MIVFNKEKIKKEYSEVLNFLKTMENSYPDIEDWFCSKVYYGLQNGSRKLFIKRKNNQIIAIGIAKKTFKEKKICTVKVKKEYSGRGIGLRLFKDMFKWLETTKPKVTVSEDNYFKFKSLFDHFHFKLTKKEKGFYLPNKTELFFN